MNILYIYDGYKYDNGDLINIFDWLGIVILIVGIS